MTAEEVHDSITHRWACQTCDAPQSLTWYTDRDKVKREATKHCNDTGHTVRVASEHIHTMEIREIPT